MKRQERIAKRERRRVARALLPSTARMDALEFAPYEPGPTVSAVTIVKEPPASLGPTFADYLKSQSIPDPVGMPGSKQSFWDHLKAENVLGGDAVAVDHLTVTVKDGEMIAIGQPQADALQEAGHEALKAALPKSAHIKEAPVGPISGFGYINEHLVALPYNIKHDWSPIEEPEAEEEDAPKSEKEPVHLPVTVVPDSSIGDYIAFGSKKAFEAAAGEVDMDGDVILPGVFKPWPEDTPVLIKKVPGNVSISAIERGATLKQHDYGHYPPPYALEPDTPSGSCPGPQGYAPEDPSRKKGVRPYSQKDARMRAKSKP